MVTLALQARELVGVLRAVVAALDQPDRPEWREYARSLADRLRPAVEEFQSAVVSARSRPDAERALADVGGVMGAVLGAATKGDMDIVPGGVLGAYCDLSTIFRESRFAGQPL